MKSHLNLLVFTSQELAMQRLTDAVSSGHTFVTSGQISPVKVQRLIAKFDISYQVLEDKNSRARRKRNGLGNAKLITYLQNDVVSWWLLVTPPDSGSHFAHQAESLADVSNHDQRLRFEEFELVKLPWNHSSKPIKANYKSRQKAARYTWRINSESYQSIRDRILEDVRSGNYFKLEKLILELYSKPGFGEIRSQVGKLVSLYQNEVKRAGIVHAPQPLKTLRYVRRMPTTGVSARLVADSFKQKLAEVKNG